MSRAPRTLGEYLAVVPLDADDLLRDARAIGERVGIRRADRFFCAGPLPGVVGPALTALVHGARLVTLPAFDADAALAMMEEQRCTLVAGDEAFFRALVDRAEHAKPKLVLRGGWAQAGPRTMRRIIDVLGAKRICAAYRPPEVPGLVTVSDRRDPEALRVEGLCTALPGLHLRTVDGEIQVRGHFTGGDWLRTGDRGVLHPGGRLQVLARREAA